MLAGPKLFQTAARNLLELSLLVEVYHFDVEPLEDRLVIFSSEWLEHEAGMFDSKFGIQGSRTFMALWLHCKSNYIHYS